MICSQSNEGTQLLQDTYRYHGHSISDPGSSYRSRDEVQEVRRARDPIERVRNLLLEKKLVNPDDVKRVEKSIKKEVTLPFLQCTLTSLSFASLSRQVHSR